MNRRSIVLLIAASLLLILPSCSTTEEKPDNAMNMINPYVNHLSKKDAEKQVGFTIMLPVSPFEADKVLYRENIVNPMLEIIIYGGDDDEFRVRKAPGSEDISGNWTSYPEKKSITIGRDLVKLEGADGRIYQAIWTSGKYSYSAFVKNGLEESAFIDLVKGIR